MADSWAQNNEPLYDQAPGQYVVLALSVNDSVSVNELYVNESRCNRLNCACMGPIEDLVNA